MSGICFWMTCWILITGSGLMAFSSGVGGVSLGPHPAVSESSERTRLGGNRPGWSEECVSGHISQPHWKKKKGGWGGLQGCVCSTVCTQQVNTCHDVREKERGRKWWSRCRCVCNGSWNCSWSTGKGRLWFFAGNKLTGCTEIRKHVVSYQCWKLTTPTPPTPTPKEILKLRVSLHLHLGISLYMCVCVCVCTCVRAHV